MKITYDSEADAMYIRLREGKVDQTREIAPDTILDFDKKGNVLGIELLWVKERMPWLLKEVKIENLIPA